ncbi:MAG: diguanylate cyclase [Longimicrobiaceae bacterium]
MFRRLLLHVSPSGRSAPEVVRQLARARGETIVHLKSADDVAACMNRTHPMALILDGSAGEALELCRTMKREPFTAVVPLVVYLDGVGEGAGDEAMEAGADEVLTPAFSERECELRLRMALSRAERDVSVHPTTRLPGTVQIERDTAERLRVNEPFAVCYADLDHFKEFNDRYGYNHGDRVILIVSRILRDVVRAHSPEAFVGHIGGDDFIFNLPLVDTARCCEGAIEVFNELIPLQYTEEDQKRGFFHGKDRRGSLYQVPIMTLSIGVVTNEHRKFIHTAQISELATEMKSFAKTLEGSVYVVDRRRGR